MSFTSVVLSGNEMLFTSLRKKHTTAFTSNASRCIPGILRIGTNLLRLQVELDSHFLWGSNVRGHVGTGATVGKRKVTQTELKPLGL